MCIYTYIGIYKHTHVLICSVYIALAAAAAATTRARLHIANGCESLLQVIAKGLDALLLKRERATSIFRAAECFLGANNVVLPRDSTRGAYYK